MSDKIVKPLEIVECPRDAMQGWKELIPTNTKISYLNQLLKVGFHTLDLGSFVSPKAIPQMSDTEDVLNGLDLSENKSRLLVIVANERGAEKACSLAQVNDLGFPFSVSETFQQRNTNSSIADSLKRVEAIQDLCIRSGKRLVVYLSMAFGNPYGDPWNEEVVFEWAQRLVSLKVEVLSLADTVGVANAEQVHRMTKSLIESLPATDIGVHLHSTAVNRNEKTDAALAAGCRRFDGALKGIGGCPMAKDDLVGNMDTEWMIRYFRSKQEQMNLNDEALSRSLMMAEEIFR